MFYHVKYISHDVLDFRHFISLGIKDRVLEIVGTCGRPGASHQVGRSTSAVSTGCFGRWRSLLGRDASGVTSLRSGRRTPPVTRCWKKSKEMNKPPTNLVAMASKLIGRDLVTMASNLSDSLLEEVEVTALPPTILEVENGLVVEVEQSAFRGHVTFHIHVCWMEDRSEGRQGSSPRSRTELRLPHVLRPQHRPVVHGSVLVPIV